MRFVVWWRRRPEYEDETLDDLIRFVMKMDAKLDRILRALGEDESDEA